MVRRSPAAAEWLTGEDRSGSSDRLARLNWLAEAAPSVEAHWTFPGGLLAKSLFEETRYCFVYGQFLATTLLGLAYIEVTFAAILYGAGRGDLERASLSKLLREALKSGWLTRDEFDTLNGIRQRRNAYTHFRKPLDESGLEFRALAEDEFPYGIVEQDARSAMEAVFRLVANNAA
jgi:hypothetical protein